jgi:hypothetical protein
VNSDAKIAPLKKSILLGALAALLLIQASQGSAQSGATLTLRHLETDAFPLMAGYIDARDSTGARISDLQPEQLQAVEDGQVQPIAQLRTVQPGLRVILIINPSEPFNIRDGEGITRFDHAKEQVLDWATALSSVSATSLSLITPEGVMLADQPVANWIPEVELIQPDFPHADVDPQTLVRALELAAQPGPEPGMGTAIWWITATPSLDSLSTLPDWQANLNRQGISLFIWQIDSRSGFESEATQNLQSLASASGGQWFGFSSGEEFPSPETYFNPLRNAYFFQYSSKLHTAGSHEIQVQMDVDGSVVTSQALRFDLALLPPNPILVTPPAQVERRPSEQDPQLLSPFSQPIEILVEFPDEIDRNLVRSTLFVNDAIVAENRTAPFIRFAWDLSGYDISQQVLLRVEVEDELGLVGSSVEFPVQLIVSNPPSFFQAFLSRGGPWLAISGILLAAAALFFVMVLSGRIKPSQIGASLFRRSKPVSAKIDPLSDSPLDAAEVTNVSPQTIDIDQMVPVYLQRLTIQDADLGPQIFPVDQIEIVIGAAADADIMLAEDSVSPHHARLTQVEDSYHVADLGTDAGTWVNYAPVSTEGSTLNDGDLVHIGRVAFRFFNRLGISGSK